MYLIFTGLNLSSAFLSSSRSTISIKATNSQLKKRMTQILEDIRKWVFCTIFPRNINFKPVNQILKTKEKIKMNTHRYGGPEETLKIQSLQIQTLHVETTSDNINKFKKYVLQRLNFTYLSINTHPAGDSESQKNDVEENKCACFIFFLLNILKNMSNCVALNYSSNNLTKIKDKNFFQFACNTKYTEKPG